MLALVGCKDEGGGGDESGDGTGGPTCNFECVDETAPVCSDDLWTCRCHGAFGNGWNNVWLCSGCEASQQDADDWCENICDDPAFDAFDAGPKLCYIGPSDDGVDETGAGNCGSWDPGSEISLVSRVYYLDQAYLDALVVDPWPVVECDDTRFDPITSPVVGVEIQDSDAGELLYELGLRDGDIPLTLNSFPLQTYADVLDAFNSLYLNDGETSYLLELKRGANTIELEYELQ